MKRTSKRGSFSSKVNNLNYEKQQIFKAYY